jgi:ribosomal protein S12 methylthiotransferase accessory factor
MESFETDNAPEGLRLALVKNRGSLESAAGLRGFFARIFGTCLRKTGRGNEATVIPNFSSADAEFAEAIALADKVQRLGFDIGFNFLSRFPDSPHLYLCAARFEEQAWHASGFDFFSRSHAFVKALGESVERMLWDTNAAYWKKERMQRSPKKIGAAGMDIGSIAGFSQKQRKNAPQLLYSNDTKFLWTKALRLSDRVDAWVPTQLISGVYARDMNDEPLLRIPNSNGLATHRTFEQAAYYGLLELIERDAFMIMFFNKLRSARIDPASIGNKKIQDVLKSFARFNLSCDILKLPTDAPTTVICCMLRDESGEGPALAVGAKAHHDPAVAILGALTESYGVWFLARSYGLYKKELPSPPWNALQRIAFWGKKEHAEKLSWMREGPIIEMPSGAQNARGTAALARALQKKGVSAYAVPMSTPTLQKLGLHAVCVVSAELQPLSLDSEPNYLGGARLNDVPLSLGYEVANEPPAYPHPFP